MRQVHLAGEQRVRGSIYGADTDATYADDGPRTAEGFCGAHEGRVVAVVSKDGELSVGIEGAGDGRGERGMEGAARLGAERDICLERFSTPENISYPTRRALGRKERDETRYGTRGIEWMRTALPSLFPTSVEVLRKKRGRSLVEKTTSTSPGFAAGSAEGSKRAWTD